MSNLKLIRKLTNHEKILFEQNPTEEEIKAREFAIKIKDLYNTIASKKLTNKELIKFNPFPLLLKRVRERRYFFKCSRYLFKYE